MSAKSVRALLNERGVIHDVEVLDVKQISDDLAVVSILVDKVRFDDLFNVEPDIIETLLLRQSGKEIEVTLEPDSSDDEDGHPSITEATVTEDEDSARA